MSQILDSMSQSAVVSYPQVLQQLSTESSEEAKDSQVNAILSQGLKQVLNSLLLISFALATIMPKLDAQRYYQLQQQRVEGGN